MLDDVILVDTDDREIGSMGKLEAHQKGKLHRAVSVFIFHPDGRMMLQKRARSKYHSGGLWTNTCCSHPRPGESAAAAARRRLWEEMGIECSLKKVYAFTYKTDFPNGLTEHEYDHVFIGVTKETPVPDPMEAENWKWIAIEDLKFDMKKRPHMYTYWFRIALDPFLEVTGRTGGR